MALLQVEQSPRQQVPRRILVTMISSVAVVAYLVVLMLLVGLLFPLSLLLASPDEDQDDRYLDW